MTLYSDDMLRDLLENRLPLDDVQQLQRQKDSGRRERIIALEQERVPWDDRILVCLQEYLYVVETLSGERIVKCRCGQEYGDYRTNWKEQSLVYERHPQDGTIFVGGRGADPAWQVLREFYCPQCATLLDVEPVPEGYPFIFNFLPDLGGEA